MTWKVVKGQKNVKLSKKSKTGCTVKGLKKGTAMVRAVVGTKKYDCKVTVKKAVDAETTKSPEVTEKPGESEQPTVPEATNMPGNIEISEVLYYDGTDSCKIRANELDEAEKKYKIIVNDGVMEIGGSAFEDCSGLTELEIPSSVTSIGEAVFHGCSRLTEITVSEENRVYDSRDNCNGIIETESDMLIIGIKTTKIPSNVTSIDEEAFNYCDNLTCIIWKEKTYDSYDDFYKAFNNSKE